MKNILSKAENIHIFWCHKLNCELYHGFLKFCTNLKYLRMELNHNDNHESLAGTGNGWLLRKYPSLNHIGFENTAASIFPLSAAKKPPVEFMELKTFFQLNPNIKILSTNFYFLESNRNILISANKVFDQLNLLDMDFNDDKYYSLLNDLYDLGVFKRLHLRGFDVKDPSKLQSIHGLEELSIHKIESVIPPLPHLKEFNFFSIGNRHFIPNIINLVNIERFYTESSLFEEILGMIRRFKNIQYIKANFTIRTRFEPYFNGEYIDLVKVNEERKKLSGACKTTIYIDEELFLATKWKTGVTNLSLIELKRTKATHWKNFLNCWDSISGLYSF